MKTKKFILAIIFIVLSLVVYNYFPAKDIFQQIVVMLIFFLILPLIFNGVVLKKEIKPINTWLGNYKQGIFLSIYSLIVVGIVLYLISYFFKFLDNYTIPTFIVNDFEKFIFYEFFMVFPFVLLYEFYFRGFVVPIFWEKIGYWAILAQTLILLILVLSSDSGNFISFIPYLVFAPFAGFIAIKSNSIIYSALTQFIILFVLNLVIIRNIG